MEKKTIKFHPIVHEWVSWISRTKFIKNKKSFVEWFFRMLTIHEGYFLNGFCEWSPFEKSFDGWLPRMVSIQKSFRLIVAINGLSFDECFHSMVFYWLLLYFISLFYVSSNLSFNYQPMLEKLLIIRRFFLLSRRDWEI